MTTAALRPTAPPIPNGILAMAVFLGTEAMLFAGLVSAFLILRANAPAWPPPGQPRLPVGVTGVNTAVLLLSAYTMERAARASAGAALRWLAATLALGALFLAVQGAEWLALLRHGLGASASVYAGSFYALIGCHGLHVAAAVLTLAVLLASALGAPSAETTRRRLAACRLYWLFVVAVWPVLYVLVYLA
ncbi:MAG TPA: cytochrome c oxidase subunit 3 [Candidatus Binatia bacterium]|jgi:heme/copper-type cytochrome/quinol oxidase subunit 3|nr:cytochrome c oxidase subunit 3 [Candidatus Binatia bacterium]